MGIRNQAPRLTAALAALAVVALIGSIDAGAASSGEGPVAAKAGLKRFCKHHPKRPRCRRLRLTLSWDDNANLDLHVWDASLNHVSPLGGFIPRSFHTGDAIVEKFFDRRFTPRRQFAFGVCMKFPPFVDPSHFHISYLNNDGRTLTDDDEIFDAGQSVLYVLPGAVDPDPSNSGDWCQ
jgi:hypothetical protein